MIRERDDYQPGRQSGAETQKRTIKRGQQQARDEMYQDVGIH